VRLKTTKDFASLRNRLQKKYITRHMNRKIYSYQLSPKPSTIMNWGNVYLTGSL